MEDSREPKVQDYISSAKFMRDFYNYRKETDKTFSYRVMAKSLRIDSSYLKRIMDGKVSMPDSLRKTALKYFEFKYIDKVHFDLISCFNLPYTINYNDEDAPQPSMLATLIVEESIKLDDFKPDPKWVAEKCGGLITEEQVRDAVTCMVQMGSMKIEDGKWVYDDDYRVTKGGTSLEEITRLYHHSSNPFLASAVLATDRKGMKEISVDLFKHMLATTMKLDASTDHVKDDLCVITIMSVPLGKVDKEPHPSDESDQE